MLNNSLNYIKERLGDLVPDTAIILGSGLGNLINALQNPIEIPYNEIPDFPQTTVSGHKGCFYVGKIGNHTVVCMQGRFHLYEGIEPQIIAQVVNLLKRLGCNNLIVTNAAGSLRTDLSEGSIVLIKDHINMSGKNPLIGPHDEPYFPDMSNAYPKELREKFLKIAKMENVEITEGVYMMLLGPNYETPSEVRLFQNFGADVVGMSTVPEVICAVHQGLNVLGISVVSNLCTGLSEHKPNHQDVLKVVGEATVKLASLIQLYLEKE
jgi:inosine/guanosine/xanthosine phosphorylase family protein